MKHLILPLVGFTLLASCDSALLNPGASVTSAASTDPATMVAACKSQAADALGTEPGALLVADPSPRDGGFVSGGSSVDDSGTFQCLYAEDGSVESVAAIP